MTLIEYLNLLKCEDNQQDVDLSKVNKEYLKDFELRHEANKAKRLKQNG